MTEETINEKIRNKLSPISNIIALIDKYENATCGEDKRMIIDLILKSKSVLKQSINELSEIH